MSRGGPTSIVFATGGSGGHIYPAVAVADRLQARGFAVHFIGQQGGMEARIVPQAGFPFDGVRAGKWSRHRPDPREAFRAGLGLWDARAQLKRLEPSLVVGFGGFASFPALAAARYAGLPLALHEQNSFPGRVNRWFSAYATLIGVAHDDMARHFPKARRLIKVGLPVREARLSKAEARTRLGLPQEGIVTLVMGGSQGSLSLNEHVPQAYQKLSQRLSARAGYVLHSSGERWRETLAARTSAFANYRVDAYLDSVLAWSAADLAITRAGMSTIAEAALHGVPLIMVPLPSAAENHQWHNANAVARVGGGQLLDESALDTLEAVWRDMLQADARARAARALQTLSPSGAAERFAEQLAQLAVSPTSNRTSLGSKAPRQEFE